MLGGIRTFGEEVLLRKVWCRISVKLLAFRPIKSSSRQIYRWICRVQRRIPEAEYTRFLRNRPQMRVLTHIVKDWPADRPLRVAVLACSTGAELYSALWTIRSVRPDLAIEAVGVDISESAVSVARGGNYGWGSRELQGLSDQEMEAFFERGDEGVRVRGEIATGTSWRVDSIFNPSLKEIIGEQDIVFASNVLIHFSDKEAAESFRNIASVVRSGGYLFVWGMDLDVRAQESKALGFSPVRSNIEEVHSADEAALRIYPWKWWGLEPLDKSRKDWVRRYTTVFRNAETPEKCIGERRQRGVAMTSANARKAIGGIPANTHVPIRQDNQA